MSGSLATVIESKKMPNWTEKFEGAYTPQVKQLEKNFSGIKAGEMMLISTPRAIDAYVRAIPHGTAKSIPMMRDDLAREAGADKTCPLTASIYLRFAAEASLETHDGFEDAPDLLPFWRVIAPKDPLASKLTCGKAFIIRKREEEGIL